METTTEANIAPIEPKALGGGLEGAERNSREMLRWTPPIITPDQQINPLKDMADARARDSVQNDGYVTGAVATHRDSIVGAQYRLNAQPDFEVLGADEAWAEEFQRVVESRFNLIGDSHRCWLDASRTNTLTGLVRLAVGGFLMTGEVLATAEWLRDVPRPCRTAVQLVSPSRLCNPDGKSDDRYLRRGVARDLYGRALGYWFRSGHPSEFYDDKAYRWRYVPATKPWGRQQVIHIIEQLQPDQTRGISDIVAVLKNMRMTRKFQDVTLQNAVINASFAAAIESELPSEVVFRALGAGGSGLQSALAEYLGALGAYSKGAENVAIDGAKIPHLFPGTKLSMKPMGTPGGVGTDFEQSLLRHIASSLGLSYEQLSRDYTKTNYSSARASMSETWKFMQSRKKHVADRFASAIYALWLEEEINAGNIPLPPGTDASIFYDPIMQEALLACEWIGASRGQIDELKETQSALLRIKGGLSTLEAECARLGLDYRRVLRQLSRERKLIESLGLELDFGATKPGANTAQQTMRDEREEEREDEAEERESALVHGLIEMMRGANV